MLILDSKIIFKIIIWSKTGFEYLSTIKTVGSLVIYNLKSYITLQDLQI